MKRLKYAENNCALKTHIIGTEKKTFEIIREWEGMEVGEEVVVIQINPTIGIQNMEKIDSTTMHLLNKMKELKWRKVHLLNLFSTVTQGKLLASNLKSVDEENINYIKSIFKMHGAEKKIVIAWGNSLATNSATNQSKKELLEIFQKMFPKGKLYQIVTDNAEDNLQGTHILFLGLRYSNDIWYIEEFPLKEELKRLTKLLEMKKEKPDKSEKKKGKKGEDNVSKDNEST